MNEDEVLKDLMEDHKDDIQPAKDNIDNEVDDNRGDRSQDKSSDEVDGADDSAKDEPIQPSGDKGTEDEDEDEKNKTDAAESDDSQDSEIERVGEKKDANYRIRQLVEKQKELERKLAEKEEAEQKAKDAQENPVYTLDDFIGTLDEDGEPLTDREAKARFQAWEANYKLKEFQRESAMKEERQQLDELQRNTADGFSKFPEFDQNSDKYDAELAIMAGEMIQPSLIYNQAGQITGCKINPSAVFSKLHKLKYDKPAVKVNNIPSDDTKAISSQQVNKSSPKYEPGFRGEVDKELDKLIGKGK